MNDEKKSAGKLQERTKKNLTIYAILMVAFVLALMLGSYINQKRVDKEMAQALKSLDEKTAYAEGIEHNIALLQEENVELKETVAALQEKISELETDAKTVQGEKELLQTVLSVKDEEKVAALKEEEQKREALETFTSLILLYGKKDYAGCRAMIADMESEGIASKLSDSMRSEYERIIQKLD